MLDGLISHGKTVHPITLRRFDNNQIWETSYDNKQWASPSYLYKCYNGYFYDAYKNGSINFTTHSYWYMYGGQGTRYGFISDACHKESWMD